MRLRGRQLDAINAAIKSGDPNAFGVALQKTCEQASNVGQSVPAPCYEATLQIIKDAPLTWLGGILACVVSECVRRKFFRDEECLMRFANKVVEGEKPHNGTSSGTAADGNA